VLSLSFPLIANLTWDLKGSNMNSDDCFCCPGKEGGHMNVQMVAAIFSFGSGHRWVWNEWGG
jgi:hypothetical protein